GRGWVRHPFRATPGSCPVCIVGDMAPPGATGAGGGGACACARAGRPRRPHGLGLLRTARLPRRLPQRSRVRLPGRSADVLWDGALGGTVRTAALVRDQDPATKERIRAEFDRLVERYWRDDHLALPVSVKLAAALRRSERG